MSRFTLVRHGESTHNASGRWQGQSDVPLSERGRKQALAVGARLRDSQFDLRLTSDLSRASDTADAIGPAARDVRLREIDVGRWAGLLRTEVAERFPEELATLREGGTLPIGGGESMQGFEARVDALFDDLAARHRGRQILLVTHGGLVRVVLTRALELRGRPPALIGALNTSLTTIEWTQDGPRVAVFNDTAHVDDPDPLPEGARAILVSDDDRPADRSFADRLLVALRVPHAYSLGERPLGRALRARALPERDEALPALAEEHEDGAFVLVAPPARVRALIARSIEA
ncbi:MAG: histidine phosphatase family protein, partial [Sandaracinaceae bacterium]|nr:histidine phosphatase family protein [Sandaracinaceae bacterium]